MLVHAATYDDTTYSYQWQNKSESSGHIPENRERFSNVLELSPRKGNTFSSDETGTVFGPSFEIEHFRSSLTSPSLSSLVANEFD